jgi:hypothetical protein
VAVEPAPVVPEPIVPLPIDPGPVASEPAPIDAGQWGPGASTSLNAVPVDPDAAQPATTEDPAATSWMPDSSSGAAVAEEKSKPAKKAAKPKATSTKSAKPKATKTAKPKVVKIAKAATSTTP